MDGLHRNRVGFVSVLLSSSFRGRIEIGIRIVLRFLFGLGLETVPETERWDVDVETGLRHEAMTSGND